MQALVAHMEVKAALAETSNAAARTMVTLFYDSDLKFFDSTVRYGPSRLQMVSNAASARTWSAWHGVALPCGG